MRLYGTGEWWTDEACEHCIEFSRKIDEESPEKFAAFYHRIIRPDTATDEEIISVEVMLTRWIRFIDLCVKLVV